MVGDQAGSGDRDAQPCEIPVGHENVAGALRRMADRQDFEASSEQRMSRIGYLDLIRDRLSRVVEQGSLLLSRSTSGPTLSVSFLPTACLAATSSMRSR
mgnify:CR=1 FL=1